MSKQPRITLNRESLTFEQWMQHINQIILQYCGMKCDDLPDEDYWNMWDNGSTYTEVVKFVLKQNHYLND